MAKQAKKGDGAQQQHYVPKHILRNFLSNAEKEQVSVFDKRTGKIFTPNINGIMGERRFHEFVIEAKWVASFEGAICRIEDNILPVYRRVVENRKLDGTEEERVYLAYLIAFQMVRTKAQRDRFTEMDNMVRDKWGAIEEIREELDEGADHIALKVRHAEFIQGALKDFTGILAGKDFLLMEAPAHRSFYLGDNPVAMFNHEPRDDFWGNIGLAVRGIEVYLPLSHDLILCAWCPSILEKLRKDSDTDLARFRGELLRKLQRGEITVNQMRAQNLKLSELIKPRTDLLAAYDQGIPMALDDRVMDFYNSLQMRHSVRHVICPRGDFSLAERFMAENPNHEGVKIAAN
jgi:hypothetical protein